MEVNKKVGAAMVVLGASARLIPHPWNFTPMMAIALYAGAKSGKLRTGVLVTLAALFVSDAIMGFYQGMWWVYATSLIPGWLAGYCGTGKALERSLPERSFPASPSS